MLEAVSVHLGFYPGFNLFRLQMNYICTFIGTLIVFIKILWILHVHVGLCFKVI